MYSELEALLLKYIDRSLMLSEEEWREKMVNHKTDDKPVVLVINESAEKLKELRAVLEPAYRTVCVKDEASADKYLAKHEVSYIIHEKNM